MVLLEYLHLQLDGLDNLKIGGEDDSEGEDEPKHVDEEYIGNVHLMVLPRTHPLYSTAASSWFVSSSVVSSVWLPDSQAVLAKGAKSYYWWEGDYE